MLVNSYENNNINAIEIKSNKTQNNFRAILKLIKEPYNINKGYVIGNKNIVKKENKLITLPIYNYVSLIDFD